MLAPDADGVQTLGFKRCLLTGWDCSWGEACSGDVAALSGDPGTKISSPSPGAATWDTGRDLGVLWATGSATVGGAGLYVAPPGAPEGPKGAGWFWRSCKSRRTPRRPCWSPGASGKRPLALLPGASPDFSAEGETPAGTGTKRFNDGRSISLLPARKADVSEVQADGPRSS